MRWVGTVYLERLLIFANYFWFPIGTYNILRDYLFFYILYIDLKKNYQLIYLVSLLNNFGKWLEHSFTIVFQHGVLLP